MALPQPIGGNQSFTSVRNLAPQRHYGSWYRRPLGRDGGW